jgi:hypothetical protein
MSQEFTTYTITSPAGVVAVIQDPTSPNFVAFLDENGVSGLDGAEVRESADLVVAGDGGHHNNFYQGRRPFTFELLIPVFAIAPAGTLNQRIDRLEQATRAYRADGNVRWFETGSAIERALWFRRQQPYRVTGTSPRSALVALVSAEDRVLSWVEHSSGSSPVTNGGDADSFPRFTFTPTGTVTITRTGGDVPNPGSAPFVTLTGLGGGGAVTLDFKARTITQGGLIKRSALSFPSSTWWALKPGSNTFTISGVSAGWTIYWRDAWGGAE